MKKDKLEKPEEKAKQGAKEGEGKAEKSQLGIKKEPDVKEQQVAELTETCQRLQADFDNYRKRIEKEKALFGMYAKESLVAELLPILDSFEIGLQNSKDPENFKKGVELIYAQLMSMLEKEGLKQIDALGKKLDPYLHEVLLKQESDKDNVVLEELQRGYMFKEHVLRHTKVKIGFKKDNAVKNNNQDKKSE